MTPTELFKGIQVPLNNRNMQIVCKMVKSGRTFPLDVEESDTVEQVKEKIFQQEGLVPEHQYFIYAGKDVHKNTTLRDYGIKPNTILHVILYERKIST
jgi:hypothetical protein